MLENSQENMWDKRYEMDDYAYGVLPNDFLKANANTLIKGGKVLSLAEGEGRNAVFLAKQGFDVTAVDSSKVGLKKAEALAKANGVEIDYIFADLNDFDFGKNKWDAIVSIFGPLSSKERIDVFAKAKRGLKANGSMLIEAYTPEQIGHNTGGGSDVDTMVTIQQARNELAGLEFNLLQEVERDIKEGTFHHGLSAVVQIIATKK